MMKRTGGGFRLAAWAAIPLALCLLALCLLALGSCSSVAAFSYEASAAPAGRAAGMEAMRFRPRLAAADYISEVEIAGTYRDLGRQVGQVARGTVVRPARVPEDGRELNGRIIAMYRQVYPAYLEELAGIGEVFGLALEDMDLRFMERDFFVSLGWLGLDYQVREKLAFRKLGGYCSIIALNTGQGTRVGRNFEWLQPNGSLVRMAMAGEYPSIGMGLICPEHWIMDGVNQKGLFIGVMTVAGRGISMDGSPYPAEPAIDAHHFMRIILNTCATAEEALALAGRVRVWFGKEMVHLLVADRSGLQALLEFDREGRLHVTANRPPAAEVRAASLERSQSADWLLSTNFWVAGTVLNERMADYRYAMADNQLVRCAAPGPADLERIIQTIAAHPANPLFTGNKLAEVPVAAFDGNRTVWTSLYDLDAPGVRIKFWDGADRNFRDYALERR